MIGFIIKKIIGSKNDREVRRLRPLVTKVNEFEQSLQSLSDDALREQAVGCREFLAVVLAVEVLHAATL